MVDGFETYHVMNPHDDGIGIDEYVDWLIDAGYPIERIGDFGEWLRRFESRPAWHCRIDSARTRCCRFC